MDLPPQLASPHQEVNPKLSANLLLRAAGQEPLRAVLELTAPATQILDRLSPLILRVEALHEDLVQALVDPGQLTKLTEIPDVKFVREPNYAVPLQVTSEGLEALRAQLAHKYNVKGGGVKVAVIDAGFDLENPEIRGRIVEARSFRADGDIRTDDPRHGTAVAEIILDIAPEAELYLYNIATDVEFLNAVDYVISKRLDLVSLSLNFINDGWYDGSSRVSKKLEEARRNGVLPVVAAGNLAQAHWEGGFYDTDGDGWHEFAERAETNPVYLSAGQAISIFLSWDDWPLSFQDYDLYLLNDQGEIVTASRNRQTGFYPPVEWIGFRAPTSGWFYIAVRRALAVRPVYLELFVYGAPSIYYRVEAGSIANLADSRGAVTVGAFYWQTGSLEAFSSRGPTNDGRIKPDILGPDGVSTLSYGVGGFYGTSAATPHITGVAALLLSINPELTPDQLQELLERGAIDLGQPGKDNEHGAGRAWVRFAVFDTSPVKAPLVIDGIPYEAGTLPRAFLWPAGTTHRVEAPTYQPAAVQGARFRFDRWSDGGLERLRIFTYDATFEGWTAYFFAQYHLTVVGGRNVEVSPRSPTGDGWYDAGTVVTLSTDYVWDVVPNTSRQSLASYTLDGVTIPVPRSGAGRFTTPGITMDRPHMLAYNAVTQFHLLVVGGTRVVYLGSQTGDGWYDEGSPAQIRAPYTWGEMAFQSRRNLIAWKLDDRDPQAVSRRGWGEFTTPEISMRSPHRISLIYTTQYHLRVEGGFDIRYTIPSPTQDGWYDEGSVVAVETRYSWNEDPMRSRLNLVSWQLDGGPVNPVFRRGSGTFTTPGLTMDGPHTVRFSATVQYFLRVVGGWNIRFTTPSPTADGWYDAGQTTRVVSDHIWDLVLGQSRKQLVAWQLDTDPPMPIPRSEVGSYTTPPIALDGPHTLYFHHVRQFYLLVEPGEGVVDTSSQWLDEGSRITIRAITPSHVVTNRSRLVFTGWVGSLASPEPSITITIGGPVRLQAQWKTQFYVRVSSVHGSVSGEAWYDQGAPATVTITPTSQGFLIREVFDGWGGDISSPDPQTTFIVDSPKHVIARWRTDYTQLLVLTVSLVSLGTAIIFWRKRASKA